MKNSQVLPFERNRYYTGKMLTSSDFQTEQTYFNNKRRFINQTMFGAGIVCGCGVYSLDDLSILIESGVVLDDYGREIVIDASVVKKLSAIDGFEQIESSKALLCVRYREDSIHSVYTVSHQQTGEDYEYNRIGEAYEFFLLDAEKVQDSFEMEEEFFVKNVLFENEDYRMTLMMPARASRGKYVKVLLSTTKLSASTERFSYEGSLQTPSFTDLSGTHELEIGVEHINLVMGDEITKEYWLRAQETETKETELVWKAKAEHTQQNKKDITGMTTLPIKISITDENPEELVAEEVGKVSLEMQNMVGRKEYICLAELQLVRTDSAYIIDYIVDKRKNQYIAAPAKQRVRTEYLSYFTEEKQIPPEENHPVEKKHNQSGGREGRLPMIATGTLEIPLGDHVKKGDIRYSGEIMHGLGSGNVYVEIGYEYYEEDRALGANTKSTVYGRPELFEDSAEGIHEVETAIKVLNDKGSFVVAAKLGKELDYLLLTYRWVAIRFQSGEEIGLVDDYRDKSISAETPTVILGTKDSYFFNVVFHNMDQCSIAYELTENGSGAITSDGVYTAPTKEGVYEVRIYCTDMPIICTYAYAIVKKKGLEEEA